MDCVIVRVINMPLSFRGATVKDENGDYNIYLNARYSTDVQADALRHEVEHIRLGHFYSMEYVTVLEAEARREAAKDGKEVRRAREII